jgi:hypothetical protein
MIVVVILVGDYGCGDGCGNGGGVRGVCGGVR